MLLNSSLGWVISEWLYYVLLVLLGWLCARLFVRRFVWSAAWKSKALSVFITVLPFVIGFIQHPIYEDLLLDLSQDMSKFQATADYQDSDLLVIAIADCPYCKRAIKDMKLMHERNPNLRMRMVVCTADSSWLEPYEAEADSAFEVVMATDKEVMVTHAGGHFPAYVLVRDERPFCRWTNNEWGPLAKDAVERTRD